MELRQSNMVAAKGDIQIPMVKFVLIPICKAISDAVRTSLGPRGMDKMVCFVPVDRQFMQVDQGRSKPRKERLLLRTMVQPSSKASRRFILQQKWSVQDL
jgi:hypothetical protein